MIEKIYIPGDIISSEYSKFYKFLIDYHIVSIGMAFVIGNQVNTLFGNLMEDIISPIIAKLIGSSEKRVEDIKVNLFGTKILLGKFIFNLIHFYIVLLILYYLSKILPLPNEKDKII